MKTPQEVAQALLAFGETISTETIFPDVLPEAAELVSSDPYAFAVATCLQRGMPAEFVWAIPYYLRQELGHLDPAVIYQMALDELSAVFARLPRQPRFSNDAPKTLRDLTRIVMEECDGDATNMWKGQRAAQIKRTLLSIHSVGPGIANMGVLLIEVVQGVRFDDLDRKRIDIKPDVHTRRVLYRLGMAVEENDQAALDAARMMNPDYPGALDGALWWIGREWCSASNPDCENCPMELSCVKNIV